MDTSQINQFKTDYLNLIQKSDSDQLTIENQKLQFIQNLYQDILSKISAFEPHKQQNDDYQNASSYIYWVYNSLLISSLFKHALSSFLFGITLIELIPGISHFCTIFLSILYTCLDSIIFYAIEISYLKRALHIPDDYDAVCELLENYNKQLEMVRCLYHELSTIRALQLKEIEYKSYLDYLNCIHQDLLTKLSNVSEYQEPIHKIIIKYIIISIGTFSKIAASYFIAKSLLGTLAPTLMGTPLGWSFIAIIIFSGTGIFYALGEHSVTKLIHPELEIFNRLIKNFSIFKSDIEKQKETSTLMQSKFDKSTCNVETQTELSLFNC